MKRGDVVLVRFPHPSGLRGKKRPAAVSATPLSRGRVVGSPHGESALTAMDGTSSRPVRRATESGVP